MKNLQKKVAMIIVLVVLSFGLIGCDDNSVQNEKNAWAQDVNTAWDDSGLDTVAGEVDNLLVQPMTGIDYAAGTR